MMYEDPIGDICQQILIIFYCLLMTVALSVYYVCSIIWFKLIFTSLAFQRVYNEVYYFVLKEWSHLFIMHIEPWLIFFGLRRQKTWTEIEQRRIEVSARCGYEIPRTPDMVEGLKQEGYL